MLTVKYAICQELYEGWEWERQCEFTAQAGYQGLEVAPFTLGSSIEDVSADQRKQLRATAEKAGLEIIGLHWLLAKTTGFHLTTRDQSVRDKTADYFCKLTELCADLGGHLMVLGSPLQRNLEEGLSMERGDSHAIEVLEKTLPTLERCGVTLCLEPLARRETNYMTTCADAARIIDRLGHPNVKLHQDVKAMIDEPTPIPELIHNFKEQTFHFHANDENLRGPGMGEIDFVPIFEALKQTDYQGWVSVEVFDYSPGAEATVNQSLEYMKKIAAQVGWS